MMFVTLWRNGSAYLSRFVRPCPFAVSEDGSALIMAGLGFMLLVTASGVAIDMGRAEIVQSRMQNALDAAGLAVGSEASTVNINSETSKYFYANFPTSYMGTTISSLTGTANSDNSVITLSVSATVPTTIMKVIGKNSIAVSASSQITRKSAGMELVLVMDNTGSMSDSAGGGVSKLSAAKTAANSLLDVLYGAGNNTSTNLWVGVVPFSQAVNVGTTHSSWTTVDNTLDWGPSSWGGCVESRSNGTATPQYDITSDAPSVRTFDKYYDADDSTNNWITTSTHTTCTGSRRHRTCTSTDSNDYSITSSHGPNYGCPQVVTPMVAEKATVVSAINNMTAGGDTHIDLGLAWGWRMLSPNYRGLWGGEMDTNSLPLAYHTSLMNKVVVLMTDGDNTIMDNYYSAYGYPDDGQLGSNACNNSSCSNGVTEMNTRTSTVCTNMKAQGIIIYTIALGSNVDSTARTMLSNCATSASYYFLSPTTNELQGIFQQIGDSLANLRISH